MNTAVENDVFDSVRDGNAASFAEEKRGLAGICEMLATLLGSVPDEEIVARYSAASAALWMECPDALESEALEREFLDLFVVPGVHYVAPYESVYLDEWSIPDAAGGGNVRLQGLLMGPSTLAVEKCYREAGLAQARELPDHIANEMMFLSCLLLREAESGSREEVAIWASMRRHFLDDHLRRWVHLLRRRVTERARLSFYPSVMAMVEEMVAIE